MTTFTDSRIITLSADTADVQNNNEMLSSCLFFFSGLLQDQSDVMYTQISLQSAQIPISYYTINEYNDTLSYSLDTTVIKTAKFERGNYNATSFITEFKNQIPLINISLNKINGKFTFTSTKQIIFYKDGSTCYKLLGLNLNSNYTSFNLTAPYPCQFQGITRIKVVSDNLSTYSMDSTTGSYSNVLATIPVNSGAYGILLYENISGFKPILREKTINYFDLGLLDDNDNFIDFNNISWHITLQIDIIKKYNDMDRSFPNLTNKIVSQEEPEEEQAPDDNQEIPLQDSTGDSDLDFLLYQNGIYS